MSSATALTDFEQSADVRVCVSQVGADPTADRLVTLAAAPMSSVLAVVYDLSDSAHATRRLAARLPGLLRGWDRATPVWIFALGGVSPLRGIPVGTVGTVIDGGLDLLKVFDDTSLITVFRRRGSFIGRTLAALDDHAAAISVRTMLRVIVLGDGRLSDFEPAPPTTAEVICLLEPDEDPAVARDNWGRVMGDTPLYSVGNTKVSQWFSERRPSTSRRLAVRLRGAGVRRLVADTAATSASGDWFDWSPADGTLFVLVPALTWDAFGIDCRRNGEVTFVNASDLAAAPPTSAADLDGGRAANCEARAGTCVVYDSLTAPTTLQIGWRFSIEAFAAATAKRSWPVADFIHNATSDNRVAAMICFCSRPPAGTAMVGDRVVVLGVRSQTTGVEWLAGDHLAIGTLIEAYAVLHDKYEDRWYATTAASDGRLTVRVELHPIASDRLPPLRTSDGVQWSAVFSGPLRSL